MNTSDTLMIICDCGCNNGFVFRFLDGLIYLSAVQGYFSVNQHSLAGELKERIRLLATRRPYLLDTIVKKEDVDGVLKWLKAHPCSTEPVENYGRVLLSHESEPDENGGTQFETYSFILYSRLSRLDLLRRKEYKAGEIVLNEEERRKMIRQITKAIENPEIIDIKKERKG